MGAGLLELPLSIEEMADTRPGHNYRASRYRLDIAPGVGAPTYRRDLSLNFYEPIINGVLERPYDAEHTRDNLHRAMASAHGTGTAGITCLHVLLNSGHDRRQQGIPHQTPPLPPNAQAWNRAPR